MPWLALPCSGRAQNFVGSARDRHPPASQARVCTRPATPQHRLRNTRVKPSAPRVRCRPRRSECARPHAPAWRASDGRGGAASLQRFSASGKASRQKAAWHIGLRFPELCEAAAAASWRCYRRMRSERKRACGDRGTSAAGEQQVAQQKSSCQAKGVPFLRADGGPSREQVLTGVV